MTEAEWLLVWLCRMPMRGGLRSANTVGREAADCSPGRSTMSKCFCGTYAVFCLVMSVPIIFIYGTGELPPTFLLIAIPVVLVMGFPFSAFVCAAGCVEIEGEHREPRPSQQRDVARNAQRPQTPQKANVRQQKAFSTVDLEKFRAGKWYDPQTAIKTYDERTKRFDERLKR